MFGSTNLLRTELMKKSPVYCVNENTRPCFIVHAQDDKMASKNRTFACDFRLFELKLETLK